MSDESPTWLRALRTFHSESFDLRSAKDLSESMRDFMELSEGERAFHQAHLTWLQVQALGDVHAALRRLEDQLGQDLRALRKSAAKAADAQEELLDLIEEQRPAEPAPSTPAPEVIEHP